MNNEEEDILIVSEQEVEPEREDATADVIMEKPFDPKRIDIKQKNLSIDIIVKRLSAKPTAEIDLYPDFQRRDDLWNEQRQSQLIESILISFPLPAFYFDGTDNNKWLVVDGLQRLSTIRNFVVEKRLKLKGLEFLRQLEGCSFDDLSRTMQRQIEETQIVAYIINPGTPPEVKFNIFKRINTGGLTLNPQEIRHAINQGVPATFVRELSESKEFLSVTGGKVSPKRMLDREFITRFLAFYLKPFEEYKPDLDTYLNSTMDALYKSSKEERIQIEKAFKKSMQAAQLIFGKSAFRKNLRYFNRALFEVWSVTLARLDENEIETLVSRKEFLLDQFATIMKLDRDFELSITTSTGNKSRVNYRFQRVSSLIANTFSLKQ